MRIRPTTDDTIRATARAGSGDSTAAMVAISEPIIEKKTVVIAVTMAKGPFGKSPPWSRHICKVP